jgi:hypothetical protein
VRENKQEKTYVTIEWGKLGLRRVGVKRRGLNSIIKDFK